MKKFRNWVTFAVVLAMVLSLAVGVSATTSKPAGIYGLVHGTSSQSDSNVNLVATTNWVDKDPDSAYFKISGEYTTALPPYLHQAAPVQEDCVVTQSPSRCISQLRQLRPIIMYRIVFKEAPRPRQDMLLTPKEGSVCNSTYSPKGTSIWSPITVY